MYNTRYFHLIYIYIYICTYSVFLPSFSGYKNAYFASDFKNFVSAFSVKKIIRINEINSEANEYTSFVFPLSLDTSLLQIFLTSTT